MTKHYKPCLKCRKPFPAKHRFNRICKACRDKSVQDGRVAVSLKLP